MNILFIGDVTGKSGCDFLRKTLPGLKKEYVADLTIVNGENSTDYRCASPNSVREIYAAGADVITGGNHSFQNKALFPLLDSDPFLLRPANFPDSVPGKGFCIADKGSFKAAVINVQGLTYLSPLDCPFETVDRLCQRARVEDANVIIVDFHAEATGEKKAFGMYLDGRVTAVIGTHTHIPTADSQILPGKTAYMTDAGMTGPFNSVLGIKATPVIEMLKTKLHTKFETAEGKCILSGCLIEADKKSGLAEKITPITVYEK